jgi:tryptophan synthase alpha chain
MRSLPSSRPSMADGVTTETGAAAISAAFEAARQEGRAALMPYLMGGFPDQATGTAVAAAYADHGADLIELGVPFSDPLADGPTIHAADTAALEAGATLESVLETCAAVGGRVPVALMVYANMVLATGAAEFADMTAQSKASGVIVPDLPLEEQGPIREALGRRDLALIPLVAPTTPPERRARICAEAEGFVYLVSTVGVTGEREQLPPELAGLIAAVSKESSVPIAVGFGISTPEQAASVGRLADGVIIGTRLVRAVADAGDRDAAVAAVTGFLRETRDALAG